MNSPGEITMRENKNKICRKDFKMEKEERKEKKGLSGWQIGFVFLLFSSQYEAPLSRHEAHLRCMKHGVAV